MSTQTKSYIKEQSAYLFYFLLFLLFYPPFFRGLFFQKELTPTHILTGITFIVFYMGYRKQDILKRFSMVEIGLMIVTIVYIISTFTAVNLDLSIQETLKYINYLLILVMSRVLISNQQRLEIAFKTLLSASVVVVFIGIGTALEIFSYNGAFTDGMINSTFQYHNTFGIYCLAMMFLAYMLGGRTEGKWKYGVAGASFLLFFGFIFSLSRGAWILFPVTGIIYYMMVPTQYKILFISSLIGNLVGFGITVKSFSNILQSADKAMGWMWIIVGIVVSICMQIGMEKLLLKMNIKEKVYIIGIPIMALMIPVILFIFKDPLLSQLPQDLAARIGSISLGTETVTERAVFYKDALKIINDYPILGTGGGGWNTLYKMYQSYAYNSTQTHNYFVQLWVEVGTLGLALFIVTLLIYLYQSYKNYRNCTEIPLRAAYGAISAAVLSILLHSFIDFDLSLAAISIILWSLIGMQLGASGDKKQVNAKIQSNAKYGSIVLGSVLLLLSLVNQVAMSAAGDGIRLTNGDQPIKAVEKFRTATIFNPWNAGYIADYANMTNMLAKYQKNPEKVKESIVQMDRAADIGKYDFSIITHAINLYGRNGELEKVLDSVELLETYHPLVTGTYEVKSSALLNIAQQYITENSLKKAEVLLHEVVNIQEKINELNQKITNSVEMNYLVRVIEITPRLTENINKGKELLQSIEE